jgi:N6-L-threonylcarbamoyladenine synthase
MRILAIETSCDETAVSIIDASGDLKKPKFEILSNIVSSQVKLHAKWGGVVPNLARREHQRNLLTVLKKAIKESKLQISNSEFLIFKEFSNDIISKLKKILTREPELLEKFLKEIPRIDIPKIDAIAITVGPGLEPALWVGINFARALSLTWGKPLIKVNHMEGHITSALLPQGGGSTKSEARNTKQFQNSKFKNKNKETFKFPVVALLVSGGHTQLVLVKDGWRYKIIGETRDDAVGEAFDKVARILELGYPGGPAVSAMAETANSKLQTPNYKQSTNSKTQIQNKKTLSNKLDPKTPASPAGRYNLTLPRPMMHSKDFDFSFSGLKTAVLYKTQELGKINDELRQNICAEFQQACIDVLVSKTIKAAEKYKVKTVILGGGVSANKELRKQLEKAIEDIDASLLTPDIKFTSDNAAMIGAAAYIQYKKTDFVKAVNRLKADGNLRLK